MIMAKHGIVFDMDDTLYKEHRYRDSGYRTVARHFAAVCGVTPDELYRVMTADPAQAFEAVERMAAERNVEVTVAQQLNVYRSHLPEISLEPEAEAVLAELKRRGVPMALVTDGRAWGQLNKITSLGLDRFIDSDAIFATVLHDTDKHSPKPFMMAAEVLRGKGAETLTYVGDNPSKDFHHPNLMGWRTVMLRDRKDENIHRQRPTDWPAEYRATTTIDTLRELLRLV